MRDPGCHRECRVRCDGRAVALGPVHAGEGEGGAGGTSTAEGLEHFTANRESVRRGKKAPAIIIWCRPLFRETGARWKGPSAARIAARIYRRCSRPQRQLRECLCRSATKLLNACRPEGSARAGSSRPQRPITAAPSSAARSRTGKAFPSFYDLLAIALALQPSWSLAPSALHQSEP
jgi:hypothetical protein